MHPGHAKSHTAVGSNSINNGPELVFPHYVLLILNILEFYFHLKILIADFITVGYLILI